MKMLDIKPHIQKKLIDFINLYFEKIEKSYCKLHSNSNFDGWVEIHSDDIIECLTSKYQMYITTFKELGILEITAGYSKAKKICKKYKLDFNFGIYKLDSSELQIKGLCTFKIKKREQCLHDNKVFTEIDNSIRNITVDSNFQDVIEKLYKKGTINQYQKNILYWQLISISENSVYSKQDKTGRFHHNISNMDGIAKTLIRIDNEEIWEIDFSNAMCMILANLFKPEFRKLFQTDLIEKGFDENYFNLKITDDVKLFMDLSFSGKIYDYCASEASISRDNAKDEMKYIFYGKTINQLSNSTDLDERKCRFYKSKTLKIFERSFPNVLKLITDIKEVNDNYKDLCYLIFKLESSLMFNHLGKAFMKNEISSFVSIHDCFVIKKSEKTKTKKIIEKTLKKLEIGFHLKDDGFNLKDILEKKQIKKEKSDKLKEIANIKEQKKLKDKEEHDLQIKEMLLEYID